MNDAERNAVLGQLHAHDRRLEVLEHEQESLSRFRGLANQSQMLVDLLLEEIHSLRAVAWRQAVEINQSRDDVVCRNHIPAAHCMCHPDIRWPIEQWGEPCPLTERDRELVKLRDQLAEVRRGQYPNYLDEWAYKQRKNK